MINAESSLSDVAALVSETLHSAGLTATLSGGAAVSIYTDNRYRSEDMDFVTAAGIEELKAALMPLGFTHSGTPRMSVFEHPKCCWYLEFPPAPLSFGSTYVTTSECAVIETRWGRLRIITPTHSLMDRLIAAAAWHEAQSLAQAIWLVESQRDHIDWPMIDEWVIREGINNARKVIQFYRKVGRKVPG